MPVPERVPVDRTLLRDGVYGRLRDAIVDGTFAPGEQLKDVELAEWLGVSRTPVREALLRLAASGLVIAQPGRSTIVSTIDDKTVQDARDVVAAMHELAVREGVGALTEGDVAAMRDANRRFARALDEDDLDTALAADDDLHDVIVRAAGNLALARVLEQYTPVLRRAERARFGSALARRSLTRHDELIALCAAGDVAGAARLTYETWHSLDAQHPSAASA